MHQTAPEHRRNSPTAPACVPVVSRGVRELAPWRGSSDVGTGTPQRLQAPEHHYVGRRSAHTGVYVVDQAELEPLAHLSYRTDAWFDWGDSTEGALELAFAMLAHATQSRPTDLVCRGFCAEVVTQLDPAGFVLSHGDIALWLMTAFSDASSSEPGTEHPVGLARRAADWLRTRLRRG
jgi:hypothetical protein